MCFVALIALVDGLQGAATGILQGMGRPSIAAKTNFVSYWLIWLPIGMVLTYWKHNILILWASLFLAIASAAALLHAYILRTEWEQVIGESQARSREEEARLATPEDGSIKSGGM